MHRTKSPEHVIVLKSPLTAIGNMGLGLIKAADCGSKATSKIFNVLQIASFFLAFVIFAVQHS